MADRKLTGFVIAAGHLDIEWYQPLRSYRYWTIETFEELKKAVKREDFACYVLDGQVFPLKEYLDVIPEDEKEMRELIREGKLAIGPFYTQFDEWLPSAESMIRNCLYGRRRAGAYGGCMRAGYLPDNFGHPLQIPQILRGFGIDSLLFMRGLPEIPGGHPDEFIYRGLDGSEVLASHFRESYSGAFDIFDKNIDPTQPRITPYYDGHDSYLSFEWHKELADHDDPRRIARSMIANVRRVKERYPSGVIPLIAGFDHLPPQINIGDSLKAANDSQDEIEFVMGNVEDYIRMVYDRLDKPEVYDMELLGSRYQYVLLGALSTRSYLKRENFAAEALVERYTEPLDALASLYGYPDKRRLLDEAWEYLMINSAHDSIHGSSVDEVHREMEFRFAATRQIASGLIHDALAYWGRHIDRWWEKPPFSPAQGIVTYSPVGAGFPQAVDLWLPVGDHPVAIKTAAGRELPAQVLDREPVPLNGLGQARNDLFPAGVYRRVLFLDTFKASEVNVYAAAAPGSGTASSDLKGTDVFIENEYLRAETDGALIRLYDKKNNRWYYGLNLLEEEADAGDAWDFSPPWTSGEVVKSTAGTFTSSLLESGPVRAVLELKGNLSLPAELEGDTRSEKRVDMPVKFTLALYSGIARLDIRLEIVNTAKDHRLRLHLTPHLKTDFVRSQGHLAILDRPVERQKEREKWNQPVTRLLPFREWLAVEDGSAGLCVAVKGMYDYEAFTNPLTGCPELCLTLLRGFALMGRLNTMQRKGGASPATAVPGAQCLGEQNFEWSYIPYGADKNEKAPFLALAQSFLYPPVAHAVRSVREDSTMNSFGRAFGWTAPNIQFSAFKRAYNRDGYILRFFENQGKTVDVEIFVNGFSKAWLSNMNEETGEILEIRSGLIRVKAGPYKAVTLKLAKP
jgi:mannosylglycerate hydrolase